jgi:zinc transporter
MSEPVDRLGQSRSTPATGDISYGSDSSGLICGYRFSPEHCGRPIDSVAAKHWLETIGDVRGQEFIWLHFSLTNVNSVKWLRDNLSLPDHYFEAMDEGLGATRIELAEDCLVAVVNDVVYEFSYEASQTATLWMCVHRDFVISARLHPLRSVDRLQLSIKAGEQMESPVFLLAHLLRDQAEVMHQIASNATAQVDQIEDRLLAGRMDSARSTLSSLRRLFVRLRRLLVPEPGALFRLLNRPPPWFDDDDAQELRAATEESAVVLNDLSTLQERTKLLQEEIGAHATEQTNRSLFLLTMVTVLALPINIIAGFLGMNVGGIPLAENPQGFWIIAAIVASISGAAGWYAFAKQR